MLLGLYLSYPASLFSFPVNFKSKYPVDFCTHNDTSMGSKMTHNWALITVLYLL